MKLGFSVKMCARSEDALAPEKTDGTRRDIIKTNV